MLFTKILPRAQRACTFDISVDRNVWLQPALRSFAIVCDYMETALFAIVCDPRSSAIVCDHMEISLYVSLSRVIDLLVVQETQKIVSFIKCEEGTETENLKSS